MLNFISAAIISSSIIISSYLITSKEKDYDNRISAYYNKEGSFAGFIQKKKGLVRACEFSSNGSILSCSKWFADNMLIQGQNKGLLEENI